MGFYVFSTIAIFFEPKMKDFYQMFFHHLVTMALLGCSYALGYFRIGVIVLILHDVSDPLMEIAKVFNYVKKDLVRALTYLKGYVILFVYYYRLLMRFSLLLLQPFSILEITFIPCMLFKFPCLRPWNPVSSIPMG